MRTRLLASSIVVQRITSVVLTGLLLAVISGDVVAQGSKNKNNVAAPTGITFAYTPSALTINWPAVSGALRYEAVRRQGTILEQLGPTPTNAFVLPVPQAGVTYEYQITAVGRNSSASSAWFAYTVPLEQTVTLAQPVTSGTVVVAQPITSATGMVTYAGPAQLTAMSPVPGQIELSWSPVQNATYYQLRRSSTGGEVEHDLVKLDAYPSPYRANPTGYINVGIDLRWIYSYKVLAYIKPGDTEILTEPSPVASAKSLPFVQVSGLTYTLTPSTKTLGRLDVTIKWNAVNGVESYYVSDETWRDPRLMPPTTTSYVQPGAPTGYTFRVCVAAIYPGPLRQDSTAPCIDIKT